MNEDLFLVQQEIELLRESGSVIIVEGKNDARSLASLGFSRVIQITTHLDAVADHVASLTSSCAILTDLDPAGRRLYARLSRDLAVRGVIIDNRLRRALLHASRLRNIEGIKSYLSKRQKF